VPFISAPAPSRDDFPIIDKDLMDVVFDDAYCDMPYMADCGDNVVVMVGTYNVGAEGSDTQTIGIARSTDGGRSFGAVAEIEPADGPEASWAVPWYHAPSNKLYVFYVYNYEGLTSVPNSNGVGSSSRCDSVGAIAYKVSTDKGLTFGSRSLLTLDAKAIDDRNPWSGSKRLHWLYGRAHTYESKLFFGFSKMGEVVGGNQFVDTEAFVLQLDYDSSGSISNPLQLPSTGSVGLRNPDDSDITEEPDVLVDPDDGLISVFTRTDRGLLCESYSTDGGATFTTDWARRTDGTTTLANPRGPASVFRMPDGRILLWFYNNTRTDFSGRSTYWYAFGERSGNRILFGAPKVFMFHPTGGRLNYGDCLVSGEELIISMSDKVKGMFTRVPLPG
jgi:hypothetical protein